MKILVTGGAGFIGSHIVDALAAEGHAVVVVDDLSMGCREHVHTKAKFVQLDIRSEHLRTLFVEHRFDVVMHHAAQMDVRKSVEDPLFDASVNVLGTLNILECCIATGVQQCIFASTGGAIYGEQEYFPADENHPTLPLSPYGVTKLTAEKYLHAYHAIYGLNYVSLRYANVYGPRQNPHGEAGVVAIFTSKILAGEQPIINGDGTQTRDYVYVDDVVKANMCALHYAKCGIFNIGPGVETSVNELVSDLKEFTGSAYHEHHGHAKKGEQQRSVISYRQAQHALGWQPKVKLREGLMQTVESFKQQLTK